MRSWVLTTFSTRTLKLLVRNKTSLWDLIIQKRRGWYWMSLRNSKNHNRNIKQAPYLTPYLTPYQKQYWWWENAPSWVRSWLDTSDFIPPIKKCEVRIQELMSAAVSCEVSHVRKDYWQTRNITRPECPVVAKEVFQGFNAYVCRTHLN